MNDCPSNVLELICEKKNVTQRITTFVPQLPYTNINHRGKFLFHSSEPSLRRSVVWRLARVSTCCWETTVKININSCSQARDSGGFPQSVSVRPHHYYRIYSILRSDRTCYHTIAFFVHNQRSYSSHLKCMTMLDASIQWRG